MTNLHNFTRGAALNSSINLAPLTLDQVRAAAPSAFAIEKHESRSARYAYIPTSQIITAMMGEGFMPFKASQSASRVEGKQNFTKHMIRFRHVTSIERPRVGDAIPEVILINSHDGSSGYKLSAGLFRFVCSNGLIVSDSTVGSLSVPHIGDVSHKVIDGSFKIVQQAEKSFAKIEQWEPLQLTAGERLVFAKAAHELKFDSDNVQEGFKHAIEPKQLLEAKRSADRGDDLWRTLNVVQENLIKGGLRGVQFGKDDQGRGTRRRVTTREVKSIDGDVKLNKALWTLAEEMAKLKGVAAAA